MARVLQLLDLLAHEPHGLTLTELGQALCIPKSTFTGYLRALASDGFIIGDGQRFTLGPRAFRLAASIIGAGAGSEMIAHYVRELATATSESVGYAVADWEIGQVIYTNVANSLWPVHYRMRTGLRAPIYASAAGRVLLAFSPVAQQDEYFSRFPMKRLTANTTTDPRSVRRRLQEIRELGYSASFAEMLEDTAAIAVPVFDAFDNLSGALMIAAPLARMRRNFDQCLRETVRVGRCLAGLELPRSQAEEAGFRRTS